MVKIFIDKKDDIASIIEKVINLEDTEVVLVVPRGSRLGESAGNFHLLKREAEGMRKRVLVESIDEEVLALARASKIDSIHPLFEGGTSARHSLSDIVASKKPEAVREAEPKQAKRSRLMSWTPKSKSKMKEPPAVIEDEVPEMMPVSRDLDIAMEAEAPERRGGRRKLMIVVGAGLVLLLGFWAFGRLFGGVQVTIALERTPWSYQGRFTADKSLSGLTADTKTVPAMLFTETKNLTQVFKASGRKNVSQKATARVTIYNAYDSNPQSLVATTRLATPDGKIFRLDEKVTVPGAKIQDGKITPVGVEVAVTADQPGEAYNVGPIEKMTVVGFKGTPKYEGFYATMKEKASGGLIGEAAVPTVEDIRMAEASTTAALKSALDINVKRRLPEEFTVLDGASAVQVTKLTTSKIADKEGNFSVFGEGTLSLLVFREVDLSDNLLKLAIQSLNDGDSLAVQSSTLVYSGVRPDFKAGTLTFDVRADLVLATPIDQAALRKQLAGQPVRQAQTILGSLQDLKTAKIGIWPPWLQKLPSNSERITIVIQ